MPLHHLHPAHACLPHRSGWVAGCNASSQWPRNEQAGHPAGGEASGCQGPGAESTWLPLLLPCRCMAPRCSAWTARPSRARSRWAACPHVSVHINPLGPIVHSSTTRTRGLRLLGTRGKEAGWQCYGVCRSRGFGKGACSSAHGGTERWPLLGHRALTATRAPSASPATTSSSPPRSD